MNDSWTQAMNIEDYYDRYEDNFPPTAEPLERIIICLCGWLGVYEDVIQAAPNRVLCPECENELGD